MWVQIEYGEAGEWTNVAFDSPTADELATYVQDYESRLGPLRRVVVQVSDPLTYHVIYHGVDASGVSERHNMGKLAAVLFQLSQTLAAASFTDSSRVGAPGSLPPGVTGTLNVVILSARKNPKRKYKQLVRGDAGEAATFAKDIERGYGPLV
ncbi:MAG: hypothetical protein EOP84_20365, partial [Verrucomicrobiaceae bacterium]